MWASKYEDRDVTSVARLPAILDLSSIRSVPSSIPCHGVASGDSLTLVSQHGLASLKRIRDNARDSRLCTDG